MIELTVQRKSVNIFLKMVAEISKIAFLNKDRDFKIILSQNKFLIVSTPSTP